MALKRKLMFIAIPFSRYLKTPKNFINSALAIW